MTLTRLLFATEILLSASSVHAEPWSSEAHDAPQLRGVYRLYSGDIGDPAPATVKDVKVTFSIRGELAKKMFDAIGPDIRDACMEGGGNRVRELKRQNMICLLRVRSGSYSCNFGLDLKRDRAVPGLVC